MYHQAHKWTRYYTNQSIYSLPDWLKYSFVRSLSVGFGSRLHARDWASCSQFLKWDRLLRSQVVRAGWWWCWCWCCTVQWRSARYYSGTMRGEAMRHCTTLTTDGAHSSHTNHDCQGDRPPPSRARLSQTIFGLDSLSARSAAPFSTLWRCE